MTKPIISIEELSKAYRIGVKSEIPDTFVAAAGAMLTSPLRNLSKLRRLNTAKFQINKEDMLWALKEVNFQVNEGEAVGIIGRNGAGKSTLLKILSRITQPTSGHAVLRGRISSLLEVGTGFHPELTGRENIYMNGTILGMTKTEIDRKFDQIVDFSGVEKFLDTPTKRYSSGMQVRLAFSVAAHLEPEILIVDEVLAVGDSSFQRKCMGRMQDVAKGGQTVLFVSHDLGAVNSLCGRGVFLKDGQVHFDGTCQAAINSYHEDREDLSSAPLLYREDRNGLGGILLAEVNYESAPGQTAYTIHSGMSLDIMLRFKYIKSIEKIKTIACSFHDATGVKISHVDNQQVGKSMPVSDQFRCTIPRLPLAPGSYTLDILIESERGREDHVQAAASLKVDTGEFFHSAAATNKPNGRVYIEHDWNTDS